MTPCVVWHLRAESHLDRACWGTGAERAGTPLFVTSVLCRRNTWANETAWQASSPSQGSVQIWWQAQHIHKVKGTFEKSGTYFVTLHSAFARSGTDFQHCAALSHGQVQISWQAQHFQKRDEETDGWIWSFTSSIHRGHLAPPIYNLRVLLELYMIDPYSNVGMPCVILCTACECHSMISLFVHSAVATFSYLTRVLTENIPTHGLKYRPIQTQSCGRRSPPARSNSIPAETVVFAEWRASAL